MQNERRWRFLVPPSPLPCGLAARLQKGLPFGRLALVLAAALGAVVPVGCNSAPLGTRRSLGHVSYELAFTTAREVMRQYFSLAYSSGREGVIRSRPRLVESNRHGLSGPTPARQVATLVLRREGRLVTAYLAVAVQQQASEAIAMLGRRDENYSGTANLTPAELEGATTAEQRQLWRTVRYDHALQRKILDQLVGALAPAAPVTGEGSTQEKTQ